MSEARNGRVLVVDSLQQVHEEIRAMLRMAAPSAAQPASDAAACGFEVICASNEDDALRLVRDAAQRGQPYSVAFVALHGPAGRRGLETVRQLCRVDPRLQLVAYGTCSGDAWDALLEASDAGDRLLLLGTPLDTLQVRQMARTLSAMWRVAAEDAAHAMRMQDAARVAGREMVEASSIVRHSSTVLYRMEGVPSFPLAYISSNVARFGHDAARLVADPAWATRLVHPDDLPAVSAAFAALLQDHAPGGTVEYRARRGDGSLLWVENRYTPVRDAAGRLREVEGVVSDITERRNAEAERESRSRDEARHRQILDAITEPVLVKGPQSRILWANKAFRDHYGMSNAQLKGIIEAPFEPPSMTERYVMDDATVFASGLPLDVPDEEVMRFDGVVRRWHTVKSPIFDDQGRVVATVGVARDITERKEAEAALLASQAFNVAILDSMTDEVAVLDRHGVITAVNEPWRRFALENGAQPEMPAPNTGVGANYLDMCRCDGESEAGQDAAATLAGIVGVLDGSLPCFSLEYPCHSPTRQRWFSLNVTPLGRPEAGVVIAHTDITDRKMAELALSASQSFLDRTGRIGGVGGWELDIATGRVQWTSQTCRIHDREPGYQPTLDEGLHYYAPEARGVITEALRACVDTGQGFDLELPMVTANERSIWVRAIGEAEWVDGRAVRLLGAFQDITARHEMKAELRRSNELLATVLENLPCGLSVVGPDLRLMAENTKFRQMLDLPATLDGAPLDQFDDVLRLIASRGEYGADAEPGVRSVLEHIRSSTLPYHRERVRPNGAVLEVNGGSMPGGGFVFTYSDATERHRAEEQARQGAMATEEALRDTRALLDTLNLHSIVSVADRAGRIIDANAAFCRISGYSRDELLGQNHRIVNSGAQPREFWSAMWRDISGGRPWRGEVCNRAKDGSLYWVDTVIAPFIGQDGDVERYISIRSDITARKRTEFDLVSAIGAANAASEAKSLFLANMSHEIRTPMNAILGMLRLLRRTELDARQADYAGKTERAARSLLELVNEILDFSKVEAGKMTLDPQPFRLERLLRELVEVVAVDVGAKPVCLRVTNDPRLPELLLGDALRLRQVLTNLVGNAVKFTEAGEVDVSATLLEQAPGHVTLELAVRDTGIGIAPEHQASIFGSFTQAEASTTRRFGGTGLGLAISQRLVALMGGELRVDSALGQGSRFHFRLELPAVAGSEAVQGEEGVREGTAAGATAAPRLAGMRVLLAEDNAVNQQVACELLEAEGAQVQVAANGQLAVDAVRDTRTPFDCVLMDLQMPVMDGFGAARLIRSDPAQGGLPIVAMTANAMAEDREACLAAGMNDHVGKPFDLDHLVHVLRRQVGRRSLPNTARAAHAMPLPAEVTRAARGAGVEIDAAMARLGGKAEVYLRLLRLFTVDLAAMPAQLRGGPTMERRQHRARLLHTLKGLAATIGAVDLADLAQDAERQVRAGGEGDEAALDAGGQERGDRAVEQVCSAMIAAGPALARLLDALQRQHSTNEHPTTPTAATGVPDAAGLRDALQPLACQLREADMQATETMAQLQLRFGPAMGAQLQAIDRAVAALDFEGALRLCDALTEAAACPSAEVSP